MSTAFNRNRRRRQRRRTRGRRPRRSRNARQGRQGSPGISAFTLFLMVLSALTLVVVPVPVTSVEEMEGVGIVDKRMRAPGYAREEFGDGWAYQPSGCTTRQEAMAAAYDQPACAVEYSEWGPVSITDPYTGDDLPPHDVELDHLYPLRAAWDMGASTWTAEKRRTFANDPANLIVTSSAANQSKSDKLPGQWVPPRRSYRCEYSRRLAVVAHAYGLPLSREDALAIRHACSTLPALVERATSLR